MKRIIAWAQCLPLLFLLVSCGRTTPLTAITGNGTVTVTLQRPSVSFLPSTGTDSSSAATAVTAETAQSSGGTPESTNSGTGSSGTDSSSAISSNTKTTTTTTTTTTATATTTTTAATSATTTVSKPTAPKEMRAVWVSYIELNELFQAAKTVAQAKQAIDTMMREIAVRNLNTVFFHVRANSDAYYKSSYFQPAYTVKKLINAGFDPLAYAVESAHKQRLELHAWINPYRIGTQASYSVSGVPTFSATTDGVTRYYYVPTSAAAQKLIINGVREVLNGYAVDGIQYDDYFYPPDVLKDTEAAAFEDSDYKAYLKAGGTLSVADWRRAAVSSLIASTHSVTSQAKRIFGVSPALNAKHTYAKLYADPLKWLSQSGYVDYLCPQLYTGFKHQGSPFNTMVDLWLSYPRHQSVKLYFGIANYKAGLIEDKWAGTTGKNEWATNSDILKRQVLYLRSKKVDGLALYSYSYLFPKQKANLSSTHKLSIAVKEMDNLLSVL